MISKMFLLIITSILLFLFLFLIRFKIFGGKSSLYYPSFMATKKIDAAMDVMDITNNTSSRQALRVVQNIN